MKIPFNKPYLTGKEHTYIAHAITTAMPDEKGTFLDRCLRFLRDKYNYKHIQLTPTTVSAINQVVQIAGIKKGDEVVIPAYCSVEYAEMFHKLGATIVFMDSSKESPNVDYDEVNKRVTDNTKVIVVSHYAGNACSMAPILRLAKERDILVVEDCTDAFDARHRGEVIGKTGHLSVFSFHESKSITAGDMGMVVINDESLVPESNHELSTYNKPNEISCAYLLAQLEEIEVIQRNRLNEWINYYNDLEALAKKEGLELPRLSFEDRPNGQIFYVVCKDINQRNELAAFLRGATIDSYSHYVPLHAVTKYTKSTDDIDIPNAARYGNCLLRLPMYNELNDKYRTTITKAVKAFFKA